MSLNRSTEIRHIPSIEVIHLSHILDQSQSWKVLMRVIPSQFDETSAFRGKYTAEHIRIIETVSNKQGRTPTEILFDEWGTSGRVRPTVGNLLDLLIKVQLMRAADYVAIKLLNEPPPARPTTGPAAKVDIMFPLEQDLQQVEQVLNAIAYPNSSGLQPNSRVTNNQDFYVKQGPCEHVHKVTADIHLEPSPEDLMQFSRSSATSNATVTWADENAIRPALTGLLHGSQYINSLNSNSINLPDLNALQLSDSNIPQTITHSKSVTFSSNSEIEAFGEADDDDDDEFNSEMSSATPIPNLSFLNNNKSNDINHNSDSHSADDPGVPNLSILGHSQVSMEMGDSGAIPMLSALNQSNR